MDADKEFKACNIGHTKKASKYIPRLHHLYKDHSRGAIGSCCPRHLPLATNRRHDRYISRLLCSCLHGRREYRNAALICFYKEANGNTFVLNMWFSVQASVDLSDVLDRVKALTKHLDFIFSNPNRFRSLLGTFTENAASFHAEDCRKL